MIIWLPAIILKPIIISMIFTYIKNKHDKYVFYNNMYYRIILTVILTCIAVGLSIVLIVRNYAAPVEIEKIQNQRIAIESKLESGFYADSFGILDKTIINDIYEYNNTVIDKTRYIDNFWVGPFYPKAYKVLETIDYDIVNDYARLVEEKEPVQPETATPSEVENNET